MFNHVAGKMQSDHRFHFGTLTLLFQNDTTMERLFLLSRILFLVTLKPTSFLREAVQELRLVDSLAMVRTV